MVEIYTKLFRPPPLIFLGEWGYMEKAAPISMGISVGVNRLVIKVDPLPIYFRKSTCVARLTVMERHQLPSVTMCFKWFQRQDSRFSVARIAKRNRKYWRKHKLSVGMLVKRILRYAEE